MDNEEEDNEEETYTIALNYGEEIEIRQTDPKTGAQKGQKIERFDLIPPRALAELARVYGKGALKYEDNNWRKGYSWSWSLAALYRHLNAWQSGEALDPETKLSHLAHAAWHCFTLMTFESEKLGTDDIPEHGS